MLVKVYTQLRGNGNVSLYFLKDMEINVRQLIIGFLLMPPFFCLFMLDRGLLIFLPHLEQKRIGDWFGDRNGMFQSLIRVGIALLLIAIWKAITIGIEILF